jgi:RHS repeat-associated protein
MVVLQVDPSSPYAPDPGHPGYGTVAAVIADGAGLFPAASGRSRVSAGSSAPGPESATTGQRIAVLDTSRPVAPASVAAGNRRFFFYSPELHLLTESELTTSATPAIFTEYIWFNGHPAAQGDTTGTTSWTFTDHLGTPILQTSAAEGVTWRAEYEPYGAIYSLRSLDQHQPLRLPGQEAEQLTIGVNGVTSRSYNVHRWFESGTGRYGQADPDRHLAALQPFLYASGNPLMKTDPTGETVFNHTDCVLWVKKEDTREAYPVQAGQASPFPDQDGYADPCAHPNQVFKVVGKSNPGEYDGYDIDVDRNHVPHLSPYADTSFQFWRVIFGQPLEGGWKDRQWLKTTGKDEWHPLFDASDSKKCSCRCTPWPCKQ